MNSFVVTPLVCVADQRGFLVWIGGVAHCLAVLLSRAMLASSRGMLARSGVILTASQSMFARSRLMFTTSQPILLALG